VPPFEGVPPVLPVPAVTTRVEPPEPEEPPFALPPDARVPPFEVVPPVLPVPPVTTPVVPPRLDEPPDARVPPFESVPPLLPAPAVTTPVVPPVPEAPPPAVTAPVVAPVPIVPPPAMTAAVVPPAPEAPEAAGELEHAVIEQRIASEMGTRPASAERALFMPEDYPQASLFARESIISKPHAHA